MLKAALKKFQRFSSLFYFMFRIVIKQLQIFKYTSKIIYSCQTIHTTIYIKLAKRMECSSRCCKMSHRHLKLYIVIEISNQLSEKCVQQAQTVCNSIFSLSLSRILLVVLSSLSMVTMTWFMSSLGNFKLLNQREER